MQDFERFHQIAEKKEDPFMLAESHLYLGKGFSYRLQPRRAEVHMIKATLLLRELVKSGRPVEEFLVKALKSLEELQYRLKKGTMAGDTLKEASLICESHGIDDQLRQIAAVMAKHS